MTLATPPGYRPHDADSLRAACAATPAMATHLGGAPDGWTIEEIGDGNLNLVFRVKGAGGGLAVKQALPYVRLVGESWPLPLSRAHYEHLALSHQAGCAPGITPQVVHYDAAMALIAMELLEPHIIMRHGMIAGTHYPCFADTLATFCARTLYLTSDMAMKAAEKRALIAEFSGNAALCQITEDLIFTDPYRIAESNRWTSPQLDGWAEAVRHDADLKIAVSRLKLKFLSSAQALLHGDLHTGSVMVTETDTRVIDPEFAFVGPMGFDLGAVIANLLLSYFSQSGHEKTPGERDGYRAWILETITAFWTRFRARFLDLWRDQPTGDAYPPALFEGERGALRLETERQAFMDAVFADTVGFAGAKMTRRLLGLAHNIDLEWIEDPDRRALAETRALRLARALMVNGDGFSSIEAVCAAAQAVEATQPSLQ